MKKEKNNEDAISKINRQMKEYSEKHKNDVSFDETEENLSKLWNNCDLEFEKEEELFSIERVEPTAKQKELAEKYKKVADYDESKDYIFFDNDGETVLLDHADGVNIITEEFIEMMKK